MLSYYGIIKIIQLKPSQLTFTILPYCNYFYIFFAKTKMKPCDTIDLKIRVRE